MHSIYEIDFISEYPGTDGMIPEMSGDFRAKAAALRHAAADPQTDFRLVGLMIETAADLEAAAEPSDERGTAKRVAEMRPTRQRFPTVDMPAASAARATSSA
jgi:hypothetical protein